MLSQMLFLELMAVLALILANGFFAATEIAVVSARRGRLEREAEAGKRGARQALELTQRPDRFLATVQVGITLLSTLAAAFGGARLSLVVATWLDSIPQLASYAEPLALGIVVVLITYFSLVLGELVPKRLALQHSEGIAAAAAPAMTALAVLVRPAVAILAASTNLLLRLLRQQQAITTSVTEEDILYLAREGAISGSVESGEAQLIARVFRFSDRHVSAVMTPRTEIVAVEVNTPLTDVLSLFQKSGFSRLPVYERNLDNVLGILHAKDLLGAQQVDKQANLLRFVRPPVYVVEHQRIADLLSAFRQQRVHLALVVDEYGQVAGLITLEDVLEELVGEIQDEYDTMEDTAFVQREDGSWLVDGMESYETVRERTGLPPRSPEEQAEYTSLAGLLLTHLDRIPTVGDTVTVGDWVLEVVDMDGLRIDRVLIRRRS